MKPTGRHMGGLFLSVAMLAGLSLPAKAAQYALLTGVGRLAERVTPPLDGPSFDVRALRSLLVERYGFPAGNIVELTDEHATKKAILDALSTLVRTAGAGDRLLFYFSGHGTSAYDGGMLQLAAGIGPNSGALIPYDLRTRNTEAILDSLIIGNRDLRPILLQLSGAARAWVVLDACFSEYSSRALGSSREGRSRAVTLVNIFPPPGTPAESFPAQDAYPYPNVISFSASSKDQPAEDIGWPALRHGRHTIDRQPHGAFTNGLLLALNGQADLNHDGSVTFDEIFRSTRRYLDNSARQTPRIHARGEEILREAVLRDTAAKTPLPSTAETGIRVAFEGTDAGLRRRIAQLAGVLITEGEFDLLVRQHAGLYSLHSSSLALLRNYTVAETPLLLKRISAQPDVTRLLNLRFPDQNFGLSVDITALAADGSPVRDGPGHFHLGEAVAVTASVDRPSYLLVLNIDSSGAITVLYPHVVPVVLPANKPAIVSRSRVGKPLGSEFVKVFASAQRPEGAAAFTSEETPTIEPGDARYHRLLEMVAASSGDRAETLLRILTED
jgi:hypothetical protein